MNYYKTNRMIPEVGNPPKHSSFMNSISHQWFGSWTFVVVGARQELFHKKDCRWWFGLQNRDHLKTEMLQGRHCERKVHVWVFFKFKCTERPRTFMLRLVSGLWLSHVNPKSYPSLPALLRRQNPLAAPNPSQVTWWNAGGRNQPQGLACWHVGMVPTWLQKRLRCLFVFRGNANQFLLSHAKSATSESQEWSL